MRDELSRLQHTELGELARQALRQVRVTLGAEVQGVDEVAVVGRQGGFEAELAGVYYRNVHPGGDIFEYVGVGELNGSLALLLAPG